MRALRIRYRPTFFQGLTESLLNSPPNPLSFERKRGGILRSGGADGISIFVLKAHSWSLPILLTRKLHSKSPEALS